MNRRFLAVLGLSAVLALVVSGIFYQVTTSARRPRKAVIETKAVVVTTNPVPLGGVIKVTDLKIAPWPADNLPAGSFAKIEDVVDRVAVGMILPEEPVLAGRLAARGSGVGLSPMITPGMRAIAVRVNEVIGVAGFALPGSRVDVLVTGVPRIPGQLGPVTKTVLANLLVISAGSNIQPDAKGQPVNVPVVTLLVTPEQGELLTLASSEGRIQLALRNNMDDKNVVSVGFRATELYAGVGKGAAPPAAPRAVRVGVPVKVAAPRAPPPPPPPQIELIRGEKKTTEVVQTVYR